MIYALNVCIGLGKVMIYAHNKHFLLNNSFNFSWDLLGHRLRRVYMYLCVYVYAMLIIGSIKQVMIRYVMILQEETRAKAWILGLNDTLESESEFSLPNSLR